MAAILVKRGCVIDLDDFTYHLVEGRKYTDKADSIFWVYAKAMVERGTAYLCSDDDGAIKIPGG